jgi:hypothetical protein
MVAIIVGIIAELIKLASKVMEADDGTTFSDQIFWTAVVSVGLFVLSWLSELIRQIVKRARA